MAGVGFLVLAFSDEQAGDQALDAMKQAKKQQQFYFEDAAVIRQDAKGKVHYHETVDMSTGKGAGIGALVGGVLGILGGPAGVAVGAGLGAAIAGPDKGFRNASLNTVGIALKPGTSAVAVITSHDFLRAVQKQVPIEDVRTAVANLAAEISARLGEGKDVAIGLLLTEQGIAIKEIAVNEESTEVVGAVITADGAAYQVAVATDEGAAMEAGVITDEDAVVVDAVALPEATEGAAAETDENKIPAADSAKEAPAPAA